MDVWSLIQMLHVFMQHCCVGYCSLGATIRIDMEYTSTFSIQAGILFYENYSLKKRILTSESYDTNKVLLFYK